MDDPLLEALDDIRADIAADAEWAEFEDELRKLLQSSSLGSGFCWGSSTLRKDFDKGYHSQVRSELKRNLHKIYQTTDGNEYDSLLKKTVSQIQWLVEVYRDEAFEAYLDKLLPDIERGEKIKLARQFQSENYSIQRRAEWGKYIPWLNEYFERNPSHCVTDARTACAKSVGVSLKTIERRTAGYQKPT